jgi:hypothetical protein
MQNLGNGATPAFAHANDAATIEDDIAAILREGVLVVCFQRACDALRDPRLGHKERGVLASLLECMNSETGTAWPSRETIAERLKFSVKTVCNALYELKRLNYIDWQRRATPGARRLLLNYALPVARHDREALQKAINEFVAEHRSVEIAANARPSKLPCPQGIKTTPPAGHAPNTGQEGAPPPGQQSAPSVGEQELTKGTYLKEKNIRAVDTAPIDDVFEQFWLAFPDERRRGKGKCRDLFRQIASGKHAKRKASAEQMLAAIRAGNGFDPNFPPMPETWLNQGRWEDLPKGARPAEENEPEPVDGKEWGWWRRREASIRALPIPRWESALANHPPNGTWPWWVLGPPPGHPECLLPKQLIEKYNYLEIYRGQIHHS